ncbi:MAG: hypothetical protein KAT49_03375, partial [Methanomicrobia archaeon]|nr:hypothetical protein [Methanomicrobia archaeon]
MNKEGSVKITSLFVILSLLAAILPIYSLDRPEGDIEEINNQCVGNRSFSIDINDADYAILEVKGEGVQRYEEGVIKQEGSEGYKALSRTQTFTCNGEITKVSVYIRPPRIYNHVVNIVWPTIRRVFLFGLTRVVYRRIPMVYRRIPTRPVSVRFTLYLKDLNDNIVFQSQIRVSALGRPLWATLEVPNLSLNGQYKLQLIGAKEFLWYYGSGYSGGSADFNANKDFCFRIHCREETTVYPELVQ